MNAVVIAYGRAPVGKAKKGAYAWSHPVEYGGQALAGVLSRVSEISAEDIDDVVLGCAQPFGTQGSGIARMIVSRAGLPCRVPAQVINRGCGSGLSAIACAANGIMSGQQQLVIAGGVEDMSRIVMGKRNPEDLCEWIKENDPGQYVPMGLTAENVAELYHVSRQEMDAYAVESHRRAARAIENGEFLNQIVPIMAPDANGEERLITTDEGVRPDTTEESLSKLKPCFKPDGRVTAATASQMSDGAGFLVLASEEKAKELGIRPIARFVAFATEGVPPEQMGIGPIYTVPKLLKMTGLTLDEMSVIELNEAFAAQTIPVMRELGLDPAKTNPNGGAIAMGHPMGATGANLSCKVLGYLEKHGGRYGMVTMCVGGGMGAACIYEMLEH